LSRGHFYFAEKGHFYFAATDQIQDFWRLSLGPRLRLARFFGGVRLLFSALFHAVGGLQIRGIFEVLLTAAAFCVLISTRVSPVIVVLGVACTTVILTLTAAA
jgi:hypothetical protein